MNKRFENLFEQYYNSDNRLHRLDGLAEIQYCENGNITHQEYNDNYDQ